MPLRFLLPFITALSAIAALALAITFAPASPAAATTVSTAVVQKLCAGGQVVGYSAKCPTPGMVKKICADGSVVGYSAKCPLPATTWALSGWTAKAGNHEQFTLTRSSSATAGLVRFVTGDGTAHAGVDYAATDSNVPFAIGQATATVNVSTMAGAPGPNLTFYGQIVIGGRVASSGSATIIEPAPAPPPPPPPATKTCPDGSVILATATCPTPPPPPPATKTCPDGSVILATATCPAPPPPPPAPLPLTAGGRAKAITSCAATNRPEAAIAGAIYNLIEFARDSGGGQLAVLSDATHRGDGWFALYVPVGCLVGA